MRCSASATLLSGSLPMSSATIESTIWSAFCLIEIADAMLARTPVTVTALRLVVSFLGAGFCVCGAAWSVFALAVVSACCAHTAAGMANIATLIAMAIERPLRRNGTASNRLDLSLSCLFI